MGSHRINCDTNVYKIISFPLLYRWGIQKRENYDWKNFMTARILRTVPGPCQKLRGKTIELSSFWPREICATVLGMNKFFLCFMCPIYRLFRSHGGWLRRISSDQVLAFWFFKNLATFYVSRVTNTKNCTSLTHRIWQIRPLCPQSKWNMGEILAFLA